MKKIYIIATNNRTMPSRLFGLATREKYVHVSIALDKKWKKVYSFGRKNPKWMLPAGFVEEDFDEITKRFVNSSCRVYELEITRRQYYDLKTELKNNYIKNSIKFRYNIAGLPMLNFKFPFRRKYHYVCSTFCGKLLMDAGILDFDKDYSILKPKDFFELPNSKLIYEGKTLDYLNENKIS